MKITTINKIELTEQEKTSIYTTWNIISDLSLETFSDEIVGVAEDEDNVVINLQEGLDFLSKFDGIDYFVTK